jgi:hypothetical protein
MIKLVFTKTENADGCEVTRKKPMEIQTGDLKKCVTIKFTDEDGIYTESVTKTAAALRVGKKVVIKKIEEALARLLADDDIAEPDLDSPVNVEIKSGDEAETIDQ